MNASRRLRQVLILAASAGAVGLQLNATASDVKSESSPQAESWASVPCDVVQKRFQADCVAEHKRLGLSTDIGTPAPALPDVHPRVPSKEPAAIEAAKTAVDHMLGATLKDPLSAMQYSVSDIISCDLVLPPRDAAKVPDGCMCYSVNAKNSYGGYTGGGTWLVQLISTGQNYMALPVPSEVVPGQSIRACADAHMASRDAALIKAAIH